MENSVKLDADHHHHQQQHSHCNCLLWTTAAFALFVTFTFILFKFKNPLQYYVKFFIYVLSVMIFSIFTVPLAAFRPNDPGNINWVARGLRFIFNILFKIRFTIENNKYLNINQPFILISNHQSSLDFITMMNVWPNGKCTPLAKKELIWSGPFGIAIWLCGITFIDRLNHEKAKGTIEKLADRINRESLKVWIYPEGTRSARTELLPFKKGAFHLAVQAQIPIVCMVTSSYSNFYNKKERKWIDGGEVKVKILPPFQTKGMTASSVNQLTKHLQETMQKEFDQLNNDINLDIKYKRVITPTDDVDSSNLNASELNSSLKDDLAKNDSSLNTSKNLIINDDNNNSINEDENSKKFN